ncbi:MAG: hypothetical protein QOH03_5462, partial [Kribbellaceae bacterium]|nr:hypothetical protein [Kribbellaceae bacterium]
GTWTGSSWSADAEDLSDRQRILEWLEAELPNLVRLVGAAAAGDAGERLTAVRIALGMSRLGRALMRFGEFHAVMSVVIDLPVALDPRLEHGRIYQMAAALSWIGMSAEALQWSDIELPLARAIGEPTQLSASLVDRSSVLLRLNRPDEAMPYAEEALRVVLEAGALTHEAGANLSVGMLAGQLGDLPRQREAFDRAIQILSSGAPTSTALARALVGWSFRDSGQYEASLASLEEALEKSRETKTEALEAMILTELGATWLAMGDHARASEALTDGVAIAIRYPREHREAELRQRLGQALAGLGMVAEARAEWERAVVLYDRMADSRAAEVREWLTGSEVER